MGAAEPPTNRTQKFYEVFQSETRALQSQIDALGNASLSSSERSEATDRCLSDIAKLSNEVNGASDYIPAYDQRAYSQTIKALQTRLHDIRAASAPKQKFTFKSKHRDSPAVNPDMQDAATASSRLTLTTPLASIPNDSQPVQQQSHVSSHDLSNTITISSHQNKYIPRPKSHAEQPRTATLRDLNSCVVDLSVLPPDETSQPDQHHIALASLTIKTISSSLLILPRVTGPIHLTALRNTTIVVACAQFRMHDSTACDVYLACGSRPIVEGCSAVRFAPLPRAFCGTEDTRKGQDPNVLLENSDGDGEAADEAQRGGLWNQVDDFAWLVAGKQSPNWSILPRGERITDGVWRELRTRAGAAGVDDVAGLLRAVGITTAETETEKETGAGI